MLRPEVYRFMAGSSDEVIYHKIHDGWIILPNGKPLVPAEVTRAVIYFIRNPLDVAISFAHHSAITIDKTIDMMNDPGYSFCSRETKLHNQTRQRLLTWSGHAESWIDISGLPVLVIRYEDMLAETFEVFRKATEFTGIKATDQKIRRALEFSRFDIMKKQEKEKGFREKAARSESFFRKGISGDWKNVLSGRQVEKIVNTHRRAMVRFGYWPDGQKQAVNSNR